jgi:putative membrane protein
MAWPAWLAAVHLTARAQATPHPRRLLAARVALAGYGLAAWDLFLDPQMVAEGYWRWTAPTPALPGVPGVPVGNYLGWLGFALLLMAAPATAGRAVGVPHPSDAPVIALWFWTYASSVLAHAVFLDLPASAAWGALLLGIVVVPLAVRLAKTSPIQPSPIQPSPIQPSPIQPSPDRRRP